MRQLQIIKKLDRWAFTASASVRPDRFSLLLLCSSYRALVFFSRISTPEAKPAPNQKLRYEREHRAWSQQDVADLVGTTHELRNEVGNSKTERRV
jgi:hypothetical protein